jgi:hypothetical protein
MAVHPTDCKSETLSRRTRFCPPRMNRTNTNSLAEGVVLGVVRPVDVIEKIVLSSTLDLKVSASSASTIVRSKTQGTLRGCELHAIHLRSHTAH